MKNVAVMGSSGSIGRQALDVIGRFPEKFRVTALAVRGDVDTLAEQTKIFRPKVVGVFDETAYNKAKTLISDAEVVSGDEALTLGALPATDIVLNAVSGFDGLTALVTAVERGKTVALANKESLVAGGEKVMAAARKTGAVILPVDSEHSAVFQCLSAGRRDDLKRIILTASGGAYYNCGEDRLKTITPEEAVRHPNWRMGKKISVDSATMVNKGLELIEARWLFETRNVDYLIHPESAIHSMVEFNDGAVIAQLAQPDMRLPIQYALTYPERLSSPVEPFVFDRPLTFLKPDETRFRAPALARYCIEAGGTAACVMSAADEAAVKLFLERKIRFNMIVPLVEKTLDAYKNVYDYSINDLYAIHRQTYQKVLTEYIN